VESAEMALADRKEKYSLDFFCFVFFVKKKNEVGGQCIFSLQNDVWAKP
jgi:hypothetical protein